MKFSRFAIPFIMLTTLASPAIAADMQGMSPSQVQRISMDRMGSPQSSNSGSSAKIAEGQGVIEALDVQSGTIKLSHGPIKILNWPAMTMSFPVVDKKLLQDFKVGDKVRFSLRNDDSSPIITNIAPSQ